MYTPVNPSFTIQKWGLKGSKLYRRVFVMPSKCSVHLFKIASLSVRRLVPSALRSGVVPELWGPYTVLSASKNFFMSFLSAKDWISSAFFLSQESCMPLSLVGTIFYELFCYSHQTNLGVCEILVLGNPLLKSERCLWRLSSSHLLLNCVPVHLNGCRDRWRMLAVLFQPGDI